MGRYRPTRRGLFGISASEASTGAKVRNNAGTSNGRLTNQLTCPPLGSRRIDYTIRTAPEWREEPPSYVDKVDGKDPKPAWWTPQGGELPKRTRYYE